MVTNPRWVSRKGFRGHLQTLEVFSRELGDGGGGLQQAEGRVSLSKARSQGLAAATTTRSRSPDLGEEVGPRVGLPSEPRHLSHAI